MADRVVKITILGQDDASPALRSIGQAAGGLEVNLHGLGEGFSKAGALATGFATALAATGIGLALQAFGAVAGALGSIKDGVLGGEVAVGQLQAKLGLTKEEAQGLAGVAQDVWEGNWGESVADVTQAIATLRQNLGDMSDEATKGLTESALILRDTFGAGVDETTRTVGVLTKTFEGLSASDAFDLITVGFQNGLDFSGEFLDTLREYAPQFEAMGFSADQFLGILIAGAEAGAFNLDKVGDAIKEFNIRAKDGSETTADAFKALGLNAKQLSADFAAGGERGTAAFATVAASLASIEDPLKRNQIGVALFGTQWEDLEADVVGAMAEGVKGLSDFEGATTKAGAALSDNLGAAWETAKRQALGYATSAGGALLDAFRKLQSGEINLAQFIGGVQQMIQTIFGDLRGLIEQISPFIQAAIPPVQAALREVGRLFGAWVETTALPWLGEKIQALLGWLGNWITTVALPAVTAWLVSVGQAFGTWVTGTAIPYLQENVPLWLTALGVWLQETALPAVTAWLVQVGQAFGNWITGTAIPWMQANVPLWLAALGTWIQGTALPAIGAWLQQVGQAFGAWITGTAVPWLQQHVPEWLAALGEWITGTALPAVRDFLVTVGQAFGEWVTGTAVPWLQQHIPEWLAALGNWLLNDGLPQIVAWLTTVGERFGLWITETAVPWLQTNIPQWLAALGDFLLNTALPRVIELMRDLGTKFVTTLIENIKDTPQKVEMVIEAMRTLANSKLAEVVLNAGQKAEEFRDRIVEKLGETIEAAAGKAASIGQAIVDGIAGSLSTGAGRLAQIARDLVTGALDAAKNALGIRSPSLEFATVGRQIVEGLTLGIQVEQPAALRQVQLLAGQMIDAFTGQLGQTDGVAQRVEGEWRGVVESITKASETRGLGANVANGIDFTAALEKLRNEQMPIVVSFGQVAQQIAARVSTALSDFDVIQPFMEIPQQIFGEIFRSLEGALEFADANFKRAEALKAAMAAFAVSMREAARFAIEGQSLGVQLGAFTSGGFNLPAGGGLGGGTTIVLNAPVYGVDHFAQLVRAANERNGRRGG